MRSLERAGVLMGMFAAIVGISACQEPTKPPVDKEPPAPITKQATVELRTNDALVFTGTRVALRDLVSRVLNEQGRPITTYKLAAELPQGWALVGDTVVAPTTERVGRLKVTATYTVQPAAAIGASYSTGAAATNDTTQVTSAVDLKSRRWKVTFQCSAAGYESYMTAQNVYIDSARAVDNTVDSVKYAADSGWVPQAGGAAQLWISGPVVRWLRNGTVDTVPHKNQYTIARQMPDTLLMGGAIEPLANRAAVRVTPGTLQQLLRYEGGTFCDGSWYHKRGPVTLQEY